MMSKEEAIKYCYSHQEEFILDMSETTEDGEEHFFNIINLLEGGLIKPEELKDYGMDY